MEDRKLIMKNQKNWCYWRHTSKIWKKEKSEWNMFWLSIYVAYSKKQEIFKEVKNKLVIVYSKNFYW